MLPNPFKAAAEAGRMMAAMGRGEDVLVSKSVADCRTAICTTCPRRDRSTNQCLECSCWLPLAVHVATKKCDLGKWPVTNAP